MRRSVTADVLKANHDNSGWGERRGRTLSLTVVMGERSGTKLVAALRTERPKVGRALTAMMPRTRGEQTLGRDSRPC